MKNVDACQTNTQSSQKPCDVCGFMIEKGNYKKHLKTRAHIRRQEFERLVIEWENFKRSGADPSAVIAILLHTMKDGTLLFYPDRKLWPDSRNGTGQNHDRRHSKHQDLKDDIKPKMGNILEELKGFVEVYPELLEVIQRLPGSKSAAVRIFLHLLMFGSGSQLSGKMCGRRCAQCFNSGQ